MSLDWRWLRSFVAVADTKTMEEAALGLDISQSTLSRHIKQLEEELNVMLFERTGSNLMLTEKGNNLYMQAQSIRDAVTNFERHAKRESEDTSGSVKVMMHCMLGYHFAPSWLYHFRSEYPKISIDLTINDKVNLLFREAEIAIQTSKPSQLDVITQRVGQFHLGLFASNDYVSSHYLGDFDDLASQELIGFDRITDFTDHAQTLGLNIKRETFAARTDQWALHPFFVQSGIGIGIIPIQVGKALGLTRVHRDFMLKGEEIYLTAHPDVRRSPRIRIVWDHLCRTLKNTFDPDS